MKTISLILLVALTASFMAGCVRGLPSEKPPIHINPNMDNQKKYKAQSESQFFEDGSSMRMPVEGTVARGDLKEDTRYWYGRDAKGELVKTMPVEITAQLMDRGQKRYDIYCAPCHDGTGSGQGIVVKKGFMPPPSFHLDRLRTAPDGHIFDVISNGIRNMPTYRHQVPVADRWAIVAYVRALQRSQNATAQDVPQEIQNQVK
jgi:mono/diheme cytochrome c family protein